MRTTRHLAAPRTCYIVDTFLVEDTPLTKKGNKRYQNVVALDKALPWLNFNDYSSEGNESDDGGNSPDTVNDYVVTIRNSKLESQK